MIDKLCGRASYAVLQFRRIPWDRRRPLPLPWQSLKYDTYLGGYVTGITEAQLKGAPQYANDNAWNWSDPPGPARSTIITASLFIALTHTLLQARLARPHRERALFGLFLENDFRCFALWSRVSVQWGNSSVIIAIKRRHFAGDERRPRHQPVTASGKAAAY